MWVVFEEHIFNKPHIFGELKNIMLKRKFYLHEGKFPRFYIEMNINTFIHELLYYLHDLYSDLLYINSVLRSSLEVSSFMDQKNR